jgi:hypothetical protein
MHSIGSLRPTDNGPCSGKIVRKRLHFQNLSTQEMHLLTLSTTKVVNNNFYPEIQ